MNIETGEIVEYFGLDENGEELDDDEADPYWGDDRYIRIPTLESYESYRFMEKFIATVQDAHLQEMLEVAIDGRGAFRRFKDVLLRYPDERERWFGFNHEMIRQWAIDWLESQDIKISGTVKSKKETLECQNKKRDGVIVLRNNPNPKYPIHLRLMSKRKPTSLLSLF